MAEYYLAVDIGASSGRHMLGKLENGNIKLKEIYRFPNGMKCEEGCLCQDVKALFYEIKEGLKRCKGIIKNKKGDFYYVSRYKGKNWRFFNCFGCISAAVSVIGAGI